MRFTRIIPAALAVVLMSVASAFSEANNAPRPVAQGDREMINLRDPAIKTEMDKRRSIQVVSTTTEDVNVFRKGEKDPIRVIPGCVTANAIGDEEVCSQVHLPLGSYKYKTTDGRDVDALHEGGDLVVLRDTPTDTKLTVERAVPRPPGTILRLDERPTE